MQTDGNFTVLKRWLIGLSGIGIAVCSLILTKQGVGFTGDLAWMGTMVALALFCAELMFNSNFEELNWTIILLGLGAYLYSIWTNIEGFYFYRATEGILWTNFDITNFGGGIFMDVYPELAIAWALKESKIGDLLGNFVKTLRDPDKLTQPARSTPSTKPSQQYQGNQGQRAGVDFPVTSQRTQGNPIAEYHNKEQIRSQQQVPTNQTQRPAPRPQSHFPEQLKNERREPTYHPVHIQTDRGDGE